MRRDVPRRLRWRVCGEVAGGRDDGRPLLPRDPHSSHVAVEELAEMDTRIEAPCHEIAARVVFARDVEHDVGESGGERRELGTQQGRQDDRWSDESDHAGGCLAELADVLEGRADVAKCGPQPREEALASFSHPDRPRRPREQAEPQTLFEHLHGMTDGRAAHAKPSCRPGEAALFGDHREHR